MSKLTPIHDLFRARDNFETACRRSGAIRLPLGATERLRNRSCVMAELKRNGGNGANGQSAFDRIGCLISDRVADIAATPAAQIAVIVVCGAWFVTGWGSMLLTAILSIIAITLTQMVLNSQKQREIDAHRRDVAMHAKLDELIAATKRARNELVGVEEKEEDEIVQLKEEVKEAIEDAPEEPAAKETAKKAIDEAAEELKKGTRKPGARNGSKKRAASR